jgi:AraC family transcriptional regulator
VELYAIYGNIVLSELRALNLKPQSQSIIFPRQGLSLHSMPTGAGYDVCTNPGYDWNGRLRGKEKFALFQYTLSGSGLLEFHGRRYDVRPGTAMLLYLPDDNRYWLPAGGQWEFFYLCLNGVEVMKTWQFLVNKHGSLIPFAPESRMIQVAWSLCFNILQGRIKTPWQASTAAYDLAMTLLEHLVSSSSPQEKHERPLPVKRAIEYCRQEIGSPIGVEDLAAAAGYSRYHFTRLFQTSEGISPGEFILRARMQKAIELLKLTNHRIKAVARQCGFHSSGYFCKVFHKTYGVSPGIFRKSGMY